MQNKSQLYERAPKWIALILSSTTLAVLLPRSSRPKRGILFCAFALNTDTEKTEIVAPSSFGAASDNTHEAKAWRERGFNTFCNMERILLLLYWKTQPN